MGVISLNKDIQIKEKKLLETITDYNKMSESVLTAANEIEDILSVYCYNDHQKFMSNNGIMAYVFFAIELYFKAILYKKQIPFRNNKKGHDLFNLFSLMDSDIKKEIEELCYKYSEYKNYIDFNHELKNIKDGFEILRYHYEYNCGGFNYSFSVGLLKAVNKIANKMFNELK